MGMTNEENKEVIKNLKKLKTFHNGSYGPTIDLAIKALEKDIPKNPAQPKENVRYRMGYSYYDYYCPCCGEFLAFEPKGNSMKSEGYYTRCWKCGQLLKWDDEQEDTESLDIEMIQSQERRTHAKLEKKSSVNDIYILDFDYGKFGKHVYYNGVCRGRTDNTNYICNNRAGTDRDNLSGERSNIRYSGD